MTIIQRQMHTVQVDCRCDACGEGCYRPSGFALLSNPPKFPHACTRCGDKKTFNLTYPHIQHLPMNGDPE